MEPLFDTQTFTNTVIIPDYESLSEFVNRSDNIDKVLYMSFLDNYFRLRPRIQESYDNQQKSYWISASINFENDYGHFKSLLPAEQRIIKVILAFFASSDLIIVSKIKTYLDSIALPDIARVYDYMKMIENVHSEIYQRTIEVLVPNRDERKNLFNSVLNMPSIRNMSEWCKKSNVDSIEEIIFVNGLFECAFFRSPFMIIAIFKRRGILYGLGQSNEYIMRDEDMHWQFAILLKQLLTKSISQSRAYEIVNEARQIYFDFISEMIPEPLSFLNQDMIKTHFMSICDLYLTNYGFKALYKVKSELDTIHDVELPTFGDFFYTPSTNYGKITDIEKKELTIIDTDF